MHASTSEHLLLVKRIFRYSKGTLGTCITLVAGDTSYRLLMLIQIGQDVQILGGPIQASALFEVHPLFLGLQRNNLQSLGHQLRLNTNQWLLLL